MVNDDHRLWTAATQAVEFSSFQNEQALFLKIPNPFGNTTVIDFTYRFRAGQ